MLFLIAILSVLGAAYWWAKRTPLRPGSEAVAITVDRVIDGDTVIVSRKDFRPLAANNPFAILPREHVRIRVAGVDTPELDSINAVHRFAAESAKRYTKAVLAFADEVAIEPAPRRGNIYDGYNRVVAHVWYKRNGAWHLLAEELIRDGHGDHYVFAKHQTKWDSRFVRAQRVADGRCLQ